MKKYIVIGNPIEHSLSPKLHNHWIKINKIDAVYEKKKVSEDQIKDLMMTIKNKAIDGINVTVPFKKNVIPFLDKLTPEADITQSVNTIYLNKNLLTGHNTDIEGFETSVKKAKYNPEGKKVLILGSGGVVSSIIFVLNKMKVSQITISNRTRSKAEDLKNLFKNLDVVDWGEVPYFDMIINATSIGLGKEDKIQIDLSSIGEDKFFYDVIYNPKETHFLKIGKELGNKTENGKMMFVYQAYFAFKIWHGIYPEITNETIQLIDND